MKESWSHYKIQHPRAPEHSVLGVCILLGILSFYFSEIRILYGAAAVVVIAVISKSFRNLVGIFWWNLARVLQKTVSPVILFIFFFLIITPWSFLFRIFNKDQLKLKGKRDTQMTDVNYTFSDKDFKFPF